MPKRVCVIGGGRWGEKHIRTLNQLGHLLLFHLAIRKVKEFIESERKMPLEEELKYFVENLDRKIEIACGKTGHKVVEILEKVQECICAQ